MMSAEDAFAPLRSALEQAGVRYAVGGSWASTAFGEPRFTYDVDVVADLTADNVDRFLAGLPETFYSDAGEARLAIQTGRAFNVIYMPMAFKFDLFPARAFPLGLQELDRAVFLERSGLANAPTPFVSAEDILLAKLDWFRAGGEISEVQWRDIRGIVRGCAATLDRGYLERGAEQLGIHTLLKRALESA